MRSETDDDVHVLSNNLIVQIKMTMLGNVVLDVRDSSVESSKPAQEQQQPVSITKCEDTTLSRNLCRPYGDRLSIIGPAWDQNLMYS
jgi:hypothetical protein